jgi:Protein of unknown function (DUF4239)
MQVAPSPMTLLYRIPSAVLLLLAISVAVSAACGGQLYVHRRFRSQDFVQHNEVGGFIIAVVGTLYAVVLGFLTVIVWQHFSETRELVAHESAAAADAWHTAVGLPAPVRERVRNDVLDYAQAMIDREWQAMRGGASDTVADRKLADALATTGTYVPSNAGESNAQAATLEHLTGLHDDRQRRIEGNGRAVSRLEWMVLFIGATCVIGFCWLFGLKNEHTHLLMTSAVAVLITSMLILLFELQYPFRSDIGIGPDVWQETVAHLHRVELDEQQMHRPI